MKKFTLLLLCIFTFEASLSYGQFAKLYDFQAENDLVYSGNSQPAFDGTWLYDVSSNGGAKGLGCIYKVKPDGTEYTKLLDFDGTTNGRNPNGSLTLSGSVLFGMTFKGGASDYGVIYKINSDGSGYTKLMDFNGTANGSYPCEVITISESTLYGATRAGGANDKGTIFRIGIDGTGYVKLLDFDGTNGCYPYGSLTLSGITLYGSTNYGGENDYGIIFCIQIDGTGFKKLLDFDGTSNGYDIRSLLTISDSTLYGMTTYGGTNDYGTIFRIDIDGTEYNKLLDFDGANGKCPWGSLNFSNSILYGTTYAGGLNDYGTIFRIGVDGTGYVKLQDFDRTNGSNPGGSLTLLGSTLYGSTVNGGYGGSGVLFKINTDGSAFAKILDYNKAVIGCHPYGYMALSGSVMFGMTQVGGAYGKGTIFKISTDGTGYTKLLDFDGASGSYPYGSLTLSGSTLFGMTYAGGANNLGAIFKIGIDGTGYKKLLDFNGINGSKPYGSLTLSGSILYGMATYGGTNDYGIIFSIGVDGAGFTKLLDFNGENGWNPYGSLTISDSVLYGMTYTGGTEFCGTIFRINTDGTRYTKIMDFDGENGRRPTGSLINLDSVLYGMTKYGGKNEFGTIFKINTDGTGYSKLIDFDGTNGRVPSGSFTNYGSTLYGMTSWGGVNDVGTIFYINTNGTGYTKLFDFTGSSGKNPYNSYLILSSNSLYGLTSSGGMMQAGVIFKYVLPVTPPTITTSTITSVTQISATSGGNITSDGGATVTAIGVCWSTTVNPTTANAKTSDGTGTGAFTSSITGLTAGTTYHVRAYATNSAGTAYGQDLSFSTIATTVDDNISTNVNCLGQNYPNPFDQSTTIDFTLVKPSQVKLSIFNTLGKEVDVVVDELLPAGSYSKQWIPKGVSPGIYFYQLNADGFKETKRLVKK